MPRAAARGGRAALLAPLHAAPGLRPTSRPEPRPEAWLCSVRFTDCFLKTSKLVLFAYFKFLERGQPY